MMFEPKQFLHDCRGALKGRFVEGRKSQAVFECVCFTIKQGWSCLFGGLMLAILLGTYFLYPADARLARYDFIVLMAVLIQALMLLFNLETFEEARVILVFHIVGTVMEIFKVHMGSWVYPERSVLRIMDVPLFSGFMYACVGSYMARAWRIFDFRFEHFPSLKLQAVFAALAYINFFTHHYLPDIRWMLFIGVIILYGRTVVWFKTDDADRPMPLSMGLFLVASFIWFAENIGTYARAWSYPGQDGGWHIVSIAKIGSWYLLVLISFVSVASIHRPNGATQDHRQCFTISLCRTFARRLTLQIRRSLSHQKR